MTTKELSDAMAERMDMTKKDAKRFFDLSVEMMMQQMENGHGFTIPDLGTFDVEILEEREMFNPHYRQYMMIPKRRVARFHPGKHTKENLKDVRPEDG